MPRLEHHLLGNHLLENYKTLVVAGCFFAGDEAESWRARGLEGLRAVLEEQILPDGAHNELAPMYHSIIAEGLLDVINVHRVFGLECPEWLSDTARRMVGWGASIAYPDGDWPQFNDTALGFAARPAELVAYLERLGHTPSKPLEAAHTPFERREFGDWLLFADLANLGPDHNPGHGHADNLTYELCIGGRRVVVDTGISTYQVDDLRARERSTAAHNTLVIDGQDSSEVWEAFRVGRRAYTTRVATQGPAASCLAAEHDGYAHLAGSPIHRRAWQWGDRFLSVEDAVRTSRAHELATYIHLHPDYNAAPVAADCCAIIDLKDGKTIARVMLDEWQHMSITDYEYAPAFGRRIPAKCIVLSARCQFAASYAYTIEGA